MSETDAIAAGRPGPGWTLEWRWAAEWPTAGGPEVLRPFRVWSLGTVAPGSQLARALAAVQGRPR